MVQSAKSHGADDADAACLASDAGRLLLDLRKGIGTALSPEEARRAGDRLSHEFLAAAIAKGHPDDGFLSEEGADSTERLGRDRVWIVDPLDGTREFGEPPRTDWAVHVCLAVDGRAMVGAVALPARDMVLSTAKPLQASERKPGPLRIAASRTRPPEFVGELADKLSAELAPMGSAGVKAMAVVLGDVDVYVHAGGQYEWDSAAPVAVARHAGLHVSRVDGSALVYNQANPWLPDLLICRPENAAMVFDALKDISLQPRG